MDNQQEKELDYRLEALLASKTLPNQSVTELLTNSDKIYAWLYLPQLEDIQLERLIKQKSPDENAEAPKGDYSS